MTTIIDLRHLHALGGAADPELREIIDDFLDELPLNVASGRKMIESGDLLSLRDMAHKTRGMAGAMGFKPLCAVAAEGDLDTPLEDPSGWLDRLETEIATGIAAWRKIREETPASGTGQSTP